MEVESIPTIMRLLLLLTLEVSWVYCYQDGAPNQQSICQSMFPEHNDTLARIDEPKYRVDVSQTSYSENQNVIVTIVVKDYEWPMEGFLLIARLKSDDSAVGKFSSVPSATHTVCSKSGVTHSTKDKRNSTSFTWTPPAGPPPGDVYFVATVVRGWRMGFWTGLKSATVEAQKSTSTSPAVQTTATMNLLVIGAVAVRLLFTTAFQ